MPQPPNTPPGSAADRIAWTEYRMGVLRGFVEELRPTKPFEGATIGVCLHLEPKTAALLRGLRVLGARPVSTGNFGTTQDDVVAALREEGFEIFGSRGDDAATHLENKCAVLGESPQLVLDNGAELYDLVAETPIAGLLGGTEETTTGAERLRAEHAIDLPIVVINDSPLKRIFENEVGVGQSVLSTFQTVTNSTPAGRSVVVIGYGWCGRGIAAAFRSAGARVTVVDVDPVRALDAAVHGYRTSTIDDALPTGEIVITATGRENALPIDAIDRLPDGALLANAGHFAVEIDLAGLQRVATETRVSDEIVRYRRRDGRDLFVLAAGEMLNLAAGAGNPIEPMDMGLTLQLLCLLEVWQRAKELPPGPQPVPDAIDRRVAEAMLERFRPAR